jgi:hypothetical protein
MRLLVLLAALLLIVLMAVGFWLGQKAAYSGMGVDPETYRRMERELPEAHAELVTLTRELEVERTRREVDRRALELVRGDLAAQKEEISSLEEGLRFYRDLMAPGEIAQGLSLRDIELVQQAEPYRFAFRIVVQQEARKHQTLKGELYVEVAGMQDGARTSYSLAELSADVEDGVMPLRFRYFQAIEGELTLPEGFVPEGVSVVATTSSPRKDEVREQFPWQLQERFLHVGK